MDLLTIGSVLGFGVLCSAHILITKKNVVNDARGNLKANLQKRYNLINNMFQIVKIHIPEYGAMLEKLITLRLELSKNTDEKTCDEMNQEVFQMLYALIQVPGYNTNNDLELRNQFISELNIIESNITAAQNYYVSALRDYNKLASFLRLSKMSIYQLPVIKEATEQKRKDVLILLDSMVG